MSGRAILIAVNVCILQVELNCAHVPDIIRAAMLLVLLFLAAVGGSWGSGVASGMPKRVRAEPGSLQAEFICIGNYQWFCDKCGKEFAYGDNLGRHLTSDKHIRNAELVAKGERSLCIPKHHRPAVSDGCENNRAPGSNFDREPSNAEVAPHHSIQDALPALDDLYDRGVQHAEDQSVQPSILSVPPAHLVKSLEGRTGVATLDATESDEEEIPDEDPIEDKTFDFEYDDEEWVSVRRLTYTETHLPSALAASPPCPLPSFPGQLRQPAV